VAAALRAGLAEEHKLKFSETSQGVLLLADVGDIHRFVTRDRFASWNGTAPLDASSGQQQRHRLSRAGNRRINRTLHIMAIPRQQR
jgi:transposase